MGVIGTVLTGLVVTPLVYLGIAGGLILSQPARDVAPRAGQGLDFTGALAADFDALPATGTVEMRDGTALALRRYGAPGRGPLLVMVHGSGWHGMQFHGLARALANRADIAVPDLRGHGADPVRRGDVDYIGQMEDDLADLITALRQPGQEVILLGHSSGGGLVTRMAGGPHGALIDRAVLLAPFLHHRAPTLRENSGGWTQVLVRRIIGLSMLNQVGIGALNHLTVVQFAMPQVVLNGPLSHTATTGYSYRLNTGYAPRSDYAADIAALPAFLLIAGREDEAFVAEAYQPLMSQITDKGRYLLVDEVGHLDIVDAPETRDALREMLGGD